MDAKEPPSKGFLENTRDFRRGADFLEGINVRAEVRLPFRDEAERKRAHAAAMFEARIDSEVDALFQAVYARHVGNEDLEGVLRLLRDSGFQPYDNREDRFIRTLSARFHLDEECIIKESVMAPGCLCVSLWCDVSESELMEEALDFARKHIRAARRGEHLSNEEDLETKGILTALARLDRCQVSFMTDPPLREWDKSILTKCMQLCMRARSRSARRRNRHAKRGRPSIFGTPGKFMHNHRSRYLLAAISGLTTLHRALCDFMETWHKRKKSRMSIQSERASFDQTIRRARRLLRVRFNDRGEPSQSLEKLATRYWRRVRLWSRNSASRFPAVDTAEGLREFLRRNLLTILRQDKDYGGTLPSVETILRKCSLSLIWKAMHLHRGALYESVAQFGRQIGSRR